MVGLVCALGVWALGHTGLLEALEDWMFDGCFIWRGQRTTTTRVVLIRFDEDSMRALDKPYAYISPELAQLIRSLERVALRRGGVEGRHRNRAVIAPVRMCGFVRVAGQGEGCPAKSPKKCSTPSRSKMTGISPGPTNTATPSRKPSAPGGRSRTARHSPARP
jgi:hypothetical protein